VARVGKRSQKSGAKEESTRNQRSGSSACPWEEPDWQDKRTVGEHWTAGLSACPWAEPDWQAKRTVGEHWAAGLSACPWAEPDWQDKRTVGEHWAERSGGSGLFVRPQGRDWSAVQATLQTPFSEAHFILGRRVSACDRPLAALGRVSTDRSEGSLPSYRWRCSTPFPAKRAITECQDLGVRKSGVRIPSLRDGHLRFSTPNSGSATAAGDRGIEDSAFRIPYRQPTLQNWDISSKQGPPLWPDVS